MFIDAEFWRMRRSHRRCGDFGGNDTGRLSWLSYKETEIEPVTFAGYHDAVIDHIYPYFKKKV